MALASSITGDGILVSVDNNVRTWYRYGANYIFKHTEKTREEVREWVALTQSAAQAAAEAADQSGLAEGASASYSASEDNRAIGSYKLTKTIHYAVVKTVTWDDYPE